MLTQLSNTANMFVGLMGDARWYAWCAYNLFDCNDGYYLSLIANDNSLVWC